ncbi:glutamine-hydrolyzing carbamoyl-phosphate synthase small subunit [Helicobacter cynogastricus]|uniref:glutamine-hydrolyzing carbamoyl-phosphate synthase small subunit n=1 Tax=Helicobacter cynogastricus TaxID=329937 RepID=UPI000CF04D93|nr:glutamine-hydrolyzing carbamoyl-phosphate synthase small subunit [Helicobacter cynogastricus]
MASLLFENGLFLEGESFGALGVAVGEVVFNTAMSGYQEIASDPSYYGQFVVFSAPEIGVVGVNDQDFESSSCCTGILVRHAPKLYSNFRAQGSLGAWLQKRQVLGICGLDTRAIVGMLRDEGAMQLVISTTPMEKSALEEILKNTPPLRDLNVIPMVSHKATPPTHGHYDFHTLDYKPLARAKKNIGVIDFGIKQSILNNLGAVGLGVRLYGHESKAEHILEDYKQGLIGGVLLSNGPGDPLKLKEAIREIALLIEAGIPLCGICLGHQLLSLAHGHPTYKLKFGHHGSNHPVLNYLTGRIEISAQNHNYCVPESLASIATITHKNLFDGTIEGVAYKDSPILSVQHHPEASPGPSDGLYIFKEFARLVGNHTSKN